MSGGGEGLSAPTRVRRGAQSNRKKKKRLGFKLDMTPLVDITFLLLTFFMFTTTMLKPQVMEMRIPPEMQQDVMVKASELFTLSLTTEGVLYWYVGVPNAENPPEEIKVQALRAKAIELNLKPLVRNRLITVFRISRDVKYDKVIEVLDELNIAEGNITEEIMKDTDKETGQPTKRSRKFTIATLTDDDIKQIQELKK